MVNFIPVRVQVKTVPKLESNRAVLNLRSTGPGSYSKKYSNTEIDVFALHVIESDDIIYISSCEALKNDSIISFKPSYDTVWNKPSNTKLIKDYRSFRQALRDYTPLTLTFSDEGDEIVQTTNQLIIDAMET